MEVLETSMKLKWEFPETLAEELKEIANADIFWFSQTRPLNGALGWRWTSLPQNSFRNSSLISEVHVPFEHGEHVEVRLALSYRNQVLVSRTTTYHLPLSKTGTTLEVIGQLQLSDDRVAVCYKTNQPTPKFKLTVMTMDDNTINTEESISRCHLFSNLPRDNCCKASISAIDEHGATTAFVEIKLDFFVNQVEIELVSVASSRLIFSNGTHLLENEQLDQYALGDTATVIPFPLPTDDAITAIAGISDTTIAIGSSKGSLWTFQMSANQTDEDQPSSVIQLKTVGEMDTKITQIEIDHIQKTLYAVQHDKGILRCKLRTMESEETPTCVLIVNNDALNAPKEISLDPVNGHIYSLNVDNKVYRTEMIAFNATGIETVASLQYLKDMSPSNGIFFDVSKFLLYSALQNGSMMTLNPVSDQAHIFKDSGYSDVQHFRIKSDLIYWMKKKCGETDADENCIFTENLQRGEEDIPNKFTYSSALMTYGFMEEILLKPRIPPVSTIAFLTSDNSGRVSWDEATTLPFQAQSISWRNFTYFLKVTAPEIADFSPVEINTEGTDVKIEVKPGNQYNVQVQVCSDDFCSTPTATSNTALPDLGGGIPFVFTKKQADDIISLDMLGNVIAADESVKALEKLQNPHVLDNTTRTVYLAGDHSMGIFKKDLDDTTGVPKPFKDGLFVEMMSIMPSRSIILIASSYKITSYRLPTTFDFEYYSCEEPLEDCAEVMGISSDDTTGMVYFLTQARNGTVILWESDPENRVPRDIASAPSIVPFRRFLILHDKMILVTKNNHIVQTDKSLKVVNVATELERVDRILPLRYAAISHKIEFTDEIKFTEGSKTDLQWTLSPPLEAGTVVFKVSIFREKMGGQDPPIITIQSDTNFTIPSEILEAWSSAQRFDVSIQAITPWATAVLNRTGLMAPVKPPTSPTQLKIFATQQKTVDGPRALISFFWGPPTEWNGTPYQYIVNCTKDDGSWIGGPVTTSQSHYSFAVKSGKVSCQAAAANEPTNIGAFSELISIDSSELKPLVKLFAIDSTNSLISINDLAHEEPRRETRQVTQPVKLEYQAMAFIGEDLYAVRKEGESAQPVLVQIDTNHIDNTVHKVSIGGDVTRIDAMTSDWVGNRLIFVAGTNLYQLSLEPFLSTSLLNPHKLIQLTAATDAKQLAYDPFMNTAYLLTKNGSLFALDMNKNTEANLALTVPCLASQTVTWMMTEFAWNRASSPKIYALTWNGLINVDLAEDFQCNEVRIDWAKFGDKGLKSISSFAIADKLFAFVTSSEMLIYGRDTVTPITIANPPLKQILAVSQSSQPYPERSCFELPSSKGIVFSIVNEGKTGALLEVTKSSASSACQEVSMPQTQYEIYFTRKNTDKVKHVRSFSDRIHVENGILDKETDYDVTVTWLNRYSPASGVSASKSFRTGFGYPSAPRDPHAIPVTPDTVYLYWSLPETLNAPISEIKYKISQQAAGISVPTSIAVIPLSETVSSNISSDTTSCLINPCRVKIANLRPSNEYKFWVTATHISHLDAATILKDDDAVSPEAVARTLDVPGTLRPDNVTGSSLLLRWNGLEPEHRPSSIAVQYRESGGANNEWQSPTNASFEPDVATELVPITNLLSATSYDYRFVATYTGTYTIDGKVLAFKEDYLQLAQQARTKAGVPTAPQCVEAKQDEEGWIVTWKEPMSDGGSPITSYAVETRINKTAEWEIAERGLDGWKTWWRPGKSETSSSSPTMEVSEFRIRAANIEGFGAYAYTEEKKEEKGDEPSAILPYLLFLSILLLLAAMVLVACFWLKSRRRQQQKKREAEDDRNVIRLDVVANMNFSNSQSIEYDSEMRNLPHVSYDKVIIGQFLSNCSFGTVHEGEAEDLPLCWEKHVKVAVKKLGQNRTNDQNMMFMKEAILLNNLDHPNIVKELGVCITTGYEFLLLEFMEGGNLLTFLRNSVPNENQSSELSPRDLLAISVDIARGMNYLERLPHVHKNLSARKCLLSGKPGVTKLEMGVSKETINEKLSREDMERTESVRWMSPEVLKDFEFTSKSDAWAYGVLLYEVFSFGEIPYGKMDNRRVMNDVRNGMILTAPSYCPSKRIFKVIKQCMAMDPSKRPSFATILKIFETLRDDQKCQDDKPIQFNDGTENVNFNASQDSTSSREPPSPSHRLREFQDLEPPSPSPLNQKGDRPAAMWNPSGARNSAKNSIGRSMKKDKLRNPIHSMDDLVARSQRPLSIHSEDTESTDYGGASSSMHSPSFSNRATALYEVPNSRLSAAPAIGIVNDAFESSNPSLNLSRSWTGLSGEVNQNPSGAAPPPHANSMGHLRVPTAAPPPGRVNRNSSGGGGGSTFRSRVSQV
uniref:Protein roller-3 n=1 Tax=Caenorhabditis tropicalis TaxID=1561998 RepID=A0A1I7V470_9PELO